MIQLQFSRQHDVGSSLIAWFSAGDLSHVDCILPSGLLLGARSDKVGGKPAGVQYRPPDYAKFVRVVRFSIPTTQEQTDKFYDFLFHQLGKPYDNSTILGFISGRNWREQDSWICSELQAAALEAAGIVGPLYLSANKITPVALALLVSGIGHVTRIDDPNAFPAPIILTAKSQADSQGAASAGSSPRQAG